MSPPPTATPILPPTAPAPPPLEAGQRLGAAEFERRYEAMPGLKKAELIDGVVHMPSPVRLLQHGQPHGYVVTWLGTYAMFTPGVIVGDNSTVRLDGANQLQPDGVLLIEPRCGGQVSLADGYVTGGPELVVEVSASTGGLDLGPRLRQYRQSGVREYVVWRVEDGEVDWFVLPAGGAGRLAAGADGVVRSALFPGLCLDVAGLLAGDGPRVLAALQAGLADPDHAAFVARLRAAAGG